VCYAPTACSLILITSVTGYEITSATPECLGQSWNGHTLEGHPLGRFTMETGYSQSVRRDCVGVAVSVRHLKG
jgi:hypothetical protein